MAADPLGRGGFGRGRDQLGDDLINGAVAEPAAGPVPGVELVGPGQLGEQVFRRQLRGDLRRYHTPQLGASPLAQRGQARPFHGVEQRAARQRGLGRMGAAVALRIGPECPSRRGRT